MHIWVVSLTALAHLFVAPTTPHWHRSYFPAQKLAETAHKPMAVLIGNGPEGWNTICDNGALNPAVIKLLAENYLCVYVDAGEEEGKKTAEAFEADRLPLLVISDKAAKVQAFRQSGTMTNDRLAQILQRYNGSEVQTAGSSTRTTYSSSSGACQT